MKQKNITTYWAVLLLLLPCFVFAQTTITGSVKTTNGEAISFANVIEKDTSNGTVADIDGNFVLNVATLLSLIHI